MKATGTNRPESIRRPLSAQTIEHIDHWVAKYPPERKRSAVLQGLRGAGTEPRLT
jgi:NADH-quinone oxidoreductase subunit E